MPETGDLLLGLSALLAAASVLMGQADEGVPVVLIRGLDWRRGAGGSRALIRDRERDLFR